MKARGSSREIFSLSLILCKKCRNRPSEERYTHSTSRIGIDEFINLSFGFFFLGFRGRKTQNSGYYGGYCYLPLYIFCEDQLLCARLRTADRDASDGCLVELERIVKRTRAAWPNVRIMIRGDSGFTRDAIMTRCETNRVDYVLGLAKNHRLREEIAVEMTVAQKQHEECGRASRVFKDFRYRTLKSWSSERRIVGNLSFGLSSSDSEEFACKSWDFQTK